MSNSVSYRRSQAYESSYEREPDERETASISDRTDSAVSTYNSSPNVASQEDEYEGVVFLNEPSGPLLCRIHGGIMKEPVIAKCGVIILLLLLSFFSFFFFPKKKQTNVMK